MNAPLDPLYDFRSDGYGLDDARRARMRAKVLDAIPDDTATAPVATVARVEPWRTPDIDLSGAQALEALPADRGSSPQPRPSRPHWSTSRRLLVAAAVAVVIGLMAVVAGGSRSTDRQVGTLDGSSAGMSFDQLADAAAAQPDQPLAPGQYQYVRTTTATPSENGGMDLSIDDGWHTTNGSGGHQSSTAYLPAGAEPGSETTQPPGPFQDDSAGLPTFGPFSYGQILNVPTDPSALVAAVRTASPADQSDWAIAEQIAAFAGLTTTPPAVRAAGIRALANLGFRPIGAVTDPLGRAGVGFQADTPDGTEIIAFDQDTGRALAYWISPADGPSTADLVIRWGAWSRTAVTDRIG